MFVRHSMVQPIEYQEHHSSIVGSDDIDGRD